MLDASLERHIISFAHYHVHVAGIVIEKMVTTERAVEITIPADTRST